MPRHDPLQQTVPRTARALRSLPIRMIAPNPPPTGRRDAPLEGVRRSVWYSREAGVSRGQLAGRSSCPTWLRENTRRGNATRERRWMGAFVGLTACRSNILLRATCFTSGGASAGLPGRPRQTPSRDESGRCER